MLHQTVVQSYLQWLKRCTEIIKPHLIPNRSKFIYKSLPQAVYTLVACHFMFYVYILQSLKDNGLYIGYTNNLKKRLKEHQDGKSFATKGRLPIKLVHYQGFISQKDALETEKYLKTTRGWERINRMLENTLK